MDSTTSHQINELRKVATDARRHPADKIEALLDIYDLYTPFIEEKFYSNQRDAIIDQVRTIVRDQL